MDVSTLGKFLVAGRDARALLDWVFPLDVGAIAPGRARYLLALDEAGYVMDDGLLGGARRRHATTSPRPRAAPTGWRPGCATGPTAWTCTCTW